MESTRFFRTSPEVYTAMRAELDAIFGHPKTAEAEDGSGTVVVTESCLPPVEACRPAPGGDVYAAVGTRDLAMPEVEPRISAAIAAGLISEVSAAEWLAAAPDDPQL